MRLRFVLGPLALCPALLPAFACSQPEVASIGLVMKAPAGLLDQATKLTLSVADMTSAPCQASGHVDFAEGQDPQTFELQKTGCAAGASWCKEIALDKDGTTKTFAVVAESAAGILAEGCAVETIDQDPLEIAIKVQRYNPPACCNDAELQVGEQCECGVGATSCQSSEACGGITADEVCEATCVAREVPIDHGANGSLPAVGTKSGLAMAFCPGDTGIANGLRAAFTDAEGTGGADVAIRVLDDKLYTIAAGSPLTQPRLLPLLCSAITASGPARQQTSASIAPLSSEVTAVAYASDELTGAKFDIFLNPQSKLGCRDKMGADPAAAQLNTTGTDARDPDVAGGPNGSALVVWTENNQVHGRIFTEANGASPPWTLTPAAADIVIASSGSAARVAGSPKGWVVVYQGAGSGDGDGVFKKAVDLSGAPGVEERVNAAVEGLQDQPDVAMLADGRAAVVWRSAGDVFFQRYDAAGAALGEDQDQPIHEDKAGTQASPAIAGSGSLFGVTWENSDAGGIAARFLGADGGFLFNSVTGQNGDFDAGQPGVTGSRRRPAIAIGGAGFVAIGWQDESAEHPGIYVRRFPLPAQ